MDRIPKAGSAYKKDDHGLSEGSASDTSSQKNYKRVASHSVAL